MIMTHTSSRDRVLKLCATALLAALVALSAKLQIQIPAIILRPSFPVKKIGYGKVNGCKYQNVSDLQKNCVPPDNTLDSAVCIIQLS